MEIKILSIDQEELWDAYVHQHPDSIAWHSYGWSKIIKKHYDADFFPIAAIEENKICGVLPLYRINKNLISVPYAVAGGMLSDNKDIQQQLLEKAKDYSNQFSSGSITFKQYKKPIEAELTIDDNFYNRELDLTVDIEEIWNGLSKKNRDEIKAAEKENLQLIYPSQDLDSFFRILSQHQHKNGIPCVAKEWISDLIDCRWYSIAMLRSENSIKAATLVKEFKKTASFPFSCKPGPLKLNDKYLYRLYWEMIKKLQSEGFKIFHSGRIPISDETNIYRLGWGGTKHKYYYQYYPPRLLTTESTVKRNWKRNIFKAVWKRIPSVFIHKWGPLIAKKFP